MHYSGEVLLKGRKGNVTISIVLKGEHGGVSDVSNANSFSPLREMNALLAPSGT